ncbi:MAG: diacylglycerol kinase family lipid kinase [Anaerolineae bacterium]|nr:diacylglycerol kinase family lipid kinase [Anaerolineae bacterium]MDW8071346.1 diacylglycerol kinase family lipid kinase [Anaerolineae bacterium]
MKACLILNPAAGPADFHNHVFEAVRYLERCGWRVERMETTARCDATRLARRCAEDGYDVAVAVGGDGTINEVINGLAGSDTALGVIPAGTANVYAADVGIPIWSPLRPHAVREAAEIIHLGHRRRLDLGHIQLGDGLERYFFMWCGIGLDAAITREVRSEDTRRLGYLAWGIASVLVVLHFMGHRGQVTVDRRKLRRRLLWVVVSNGQLYGRLWRIAPDAKMDDGRLDVTVFEGRGLFSTIHHILGLTLGFHVHDPKVHQYRCSSVSVRTRKPLPVHVDAEPVGTTPVRISVVPRAVTVILPPKLPEHLLVHREEQRSTVPEMATL